VQYAVAAAEMAFTDSGFAVTEENAPRVGVITGCGLGGLSTIEKYHQVLNAGETHYPVFIPMVIPNMGAGQISIVKKIKGPNLSVTTACAAGTHAVGEAFRMISAGDCDVAVTGGSESVICPLAVGGFAAMKALSRNNDFPEKASRPFDRDRDGFIIAEGSGILILEELTHAKAGGHIYAEMAGYVFPGRIPYGCSSRDGDGAVRCMKMALADAGMNGRNRLHQCPRHFNAARRYCRDRGSQALFRRSCQETRDQFHQIHDRPYAGRGRWY
jgi:3-oxoacyl-[acyl-carrier-protein] synthase II